MCSPRGGRLLRQMSVGIMIATGVPGTISAQSTREARAELDRLLPEWKAANDAAADAERATRRDVRTVLVERGRFSITADAAIAPQVADAATAASASLDRMFGAEASLISSYPLVAVLQTTVRNGEETKVIRIRRPASSAPLPTPVRVGSEERSVNVRDADSTRAGLLRALEATAESPLHATLDDAARMWFRTPLSVVEKPDELANIYLWMATASTEVSRRCLTGDIGGCRQILGFSAIHDPILDGHTATQRRILVEAKVDELRVPTKAAEYDRCVGDADDAACIARLRELPAEQLTTTYSPILVRQSFARWAIGRGGAGAYSRFRSASGLALDERFALAAQMPADAMVAAWQAHVMTARPARPDVPPITAFATLFWIGACGALALRSSKWR